MKVLLLVLFLIPTANALDAVVKVLEAPLFQHKSLDAPVVQYVRKGDIIKVHPSLLNSTKYGHMAPTLDKRAKVRENLEWKDDLLFKQDNEHAAELEDEFIPTLDRNGKEAFILSEHIYVYLETPKEFGQHTPKVDPTDYRLEEPLPKNYPLYTLSGYRGQFLLGIAQPYMDNYPYRSTIQSKGYRSPVDVLLTFLKRASQDLQDRLYFGGTLNLRSFTNTFRFNNNTSSVEEGFRFALGPTISYDAYKGEKNRVNLSGTVLVNLFNQIDITQKTLTETENRQYRGLNLSPRLGVQYHRKGIFETIDFVAGLAFELETATKFNAKDAGKSASLWQETGNDTFTTRNFTTLSVALGVQSAY